MHVSSAKPISIADYRYDLPQEAIAKHPLPQRDQSRLLLYRQGNMAHHRFHELDQFIPEHARLVFNNTRVIQARLTFRKETGARIEIFCLEPRDPIDYQQSFESTRTCSWICLVGNAKKWKSGPVSLSSNIKGRNVQMQAHLEERQTDAFLVRFSWDAPDCSFGELIEQAGSTPIPPYLDRQAEEADKQRYQTVYSRHEGSVAAPTAGLHFTDPILEGLKSKDCSLDELTLHVGAGTFVPVKHNDAREHEMHREMVRVRKGFIQDWALDPQKVFAVGTTSTRSLESLYWLGVRLHSGENLNPAELQFSQWDNETLPEHCSLEDSLKALLAFCREHGLEHLDFSTSLMIVPGYAFRTLQGLITNFHMPGSTLLLLIAALIGADWKQVYQEALDKNYRFLSYGDSSLLLP